MKIGMVAFTLLAAAFISPAPVAKAQEFSKIRIARLSFVEGDVQFQRPGQDWQDARLNLPMEEGFSLRTADGYAEVEFEDALALRLGTNSTVEFTELSLQGGGRVSRLAIPEGTAIISAKLRRGDAASVVAGNMTVDLPHDARFRMDVSPGESWVTVFHGKVQLDSGTGTAASLNGGHTLHLAANASSSPEITGNPPQDDFDRWVLHREQALGEAQSETSAVLGTNYYTAGYADLYKYGVWSTIPGFGLGWLPYGTGLGWMPFTEGEWLFMGGLGWNWIGAEPWGWLPYHFGYWVSVPGLGWAWLPPSGPLYWSPASAHWVQVNNQLGWIPNAPPLGSKPTKKQVAAIPVTAVLGARTATGAFKAGSQVSLAKVGVTVKSASAPAFTASSALAAQSSARGNQSTPTTRTSAMGAPPSVRAPIGTASQVRAAELSSAPKTMLAPHSAPAPAIARGASASGFRGSSGRGAVYSGPGIGASGASAATSTQGSSAGAASHAGASTGSTGSAHH